MSASRYSLTKAISAWRTSRIFSRIRLILFMYLFSRIHRFVDPTSIKPPTPRMAVPPLAKTTPTLAPLVTSFALWKRSFLLLFFPVRRSISSIAASVVSLVFICCSSRSRKVEIACSESLLRILAAFFTCSKRTSSC